MVEFKDLAKYESQIMYVLLIIVVLYPILNPIGLPIPRSQSTIDFYEALETVPDRGTVLIVNQMGSGTWGELGSGAIAINKYLFSRDLRIVYLALGVDSPLVQDKISLATPALQKAEYGVDYVTLGYLTGSQVGMAAFATPPDGIASQFKKDYFGNDLSALPLMEEVKNINDFDLIVSYTSGSDANMGIVQQWVVPYGSKFIVAASGVLVPASMMYADAGQALGVLAGLRGCAEFEGISGYPGYATSAVDALSMYHVLVILAIIVGNILYFIRRASGEGGM
jgi:hypothetical protein